MTMWHEVMTPRDGHADLVEPDLGRCADCDTPIGTYLDVCPSTSQDVPRFGSFYVAEFDSTTMTLCEDCYNELVLA